MGKILYFDCKMGAAGDMLCASLVWSLGKSEIDEVLEVINNCGIPGVKVEDHVTMKGGVPASTVTVKVNGVEEEPACDSGDGSPVTSGHETAHDHGSHDVTGEPSPCHTHDHHHHTTLAEVREIIEGLSVTGNVKKEAIEIYDLIAKAEAKAHGTEPSIVHFHEVGSLDAICDIVFFCMLLEKLAPDEVWASEICTGFGHVHCAHGVVDVPAPATANLLEGIPHYAGDTEGELLTPTGAAILKYFVTKYTDNPNMTVEKSGYGAGKKDFDKPNVVEARIGEETGKMTDEKGIEPAKATVTVLSCNIDDMTGEEIGFAIERLRAAGALEVFAIPVTMKKSRPGHLFQVICRPNKKEEMVKNIFKYTETIGIRESEMVRYELERQIDTAITDDGEVRAKRVSGYGVERTKIEYEDAAAYATRKGISLRKAREILEKQS